MKELRPKRNDIRILFVFDPRRKAILLIGGSKTNDWHGWYERNIPEAERLYDDYLSELRKGSCYEWTSPVVGDSTAGHPGGGG